MPNSEQIAQTLIDYFKTVHVRYICRFANGTEQDIECEHIQAIISKNPGCIIRQEHVPLNSIPPVWP